MFPSMEVIEHNNLLICKSVNSFIASIMAEISLHVRPKHELFYNMTCMVRDFYIRENPLHELQPWVSCQSNLLARSPYHKIYISTGYPSSVSDTNTSRILCGYYQ